MKHDNHNRRKTKRAKPSAKRTTRKVPKAEQDFNIRGMSGDGQSVTGYFTRAGDGGEPQPLLRRIETYISAAIERIRKSLHFGWNLRTCEIVWEEMQGLYKGDVHALQTSTAMYAMNKLVKAGFDMKQPIHCDQNIYNLTVTYHQWQREAFSALLSRMQSKIVNWLKTH